jgi:hypothetical protein
MQRKKILPFFEMGASFSFIQGRNITEELSGLSNQEKARTISEKSSAGCCSFFLILKKIT